MPASNQDLRKTYLEQGFVHGVTILSRDEAADHNARLLGYETSHGPLHYLVKPYLVFSPAFEIATHPKILDAVERLLGPDILLWDSAYIIKEPQSEGYISWHQDLTYWGLDCENDDVVSAWVAVTPAFRQNGCMQFVKGSHRGPHLDHSDTYDENNLLHRGQAIEESFDESKICHLEMEAGQCSLHHGWAIHSSNPNTSDTRRVALAINYVRPSARQSVADGESATLVRGVDRYQHFRAEPKCGKDNVPVNMEFQREAERLKREVYDSA